MIISQLIQAHFSDIPRVSQTLSDLLDERWTLDDLVTLLVRRDTSVHVVLPRLDLRERGCGPEPQNCKEDVDQATYRHCAFPLSRERKRTDDALRALT